MIKATENLKVGDLIENRKPFFVPVYQRGYAWETEEVEDFINDLLVLYTARLNGVPSSTKHFFGGLVVVEHHASNITPMHKYEVVDGQQRLATFFISIALLIKSFQELAQQAKSEGDSTTENNATAQADYTKSNNLLYDELQSGQVQQKVRLTLSKADQSFFEQLMQGQIANPERESHKRLKYAADKIYSDLITPIFNEGSISTQNKLERLLYLKSSIMEDCYVIHVISDSRKEAYALFKVLNDRGRTLSDGDLLRSHTLELLEGFSSKQIQVERYWDEILGASLTEIDRFLRSYFASHVGQRAPSRDLFDHFRKHFFPYSNVQISSSDASKIEKRISTFKAEFEVFSKLQDGEWPYDDPKTSIWDRDRLSRLVITLKHKLCIPLLLSAYNCLPEKDFSKLINWLERFVFRYINMVGAHPTPLEERYYKYAMMMRSQCGSFKLSDFKSELRTMGLTSASDDLFKATLLGPKLNYSHSSQRKLIKYFLTTLEDHYDWFKNGASGEPKPDRTMSFDLNQITIEHIYPQNPSTLSTKLEPLKQELGNLSFWSSDDNRAAGNALFASKKTKYSQSKIKLTQELSSLSSWDDNSLQNRRDRLIRMALKVFKM